MKIWLPEIYTVKIKCVGIAVNRNHFNCSEEETFALLLVFCNFSSIPPELWSHIGHKRFHTLSTQRPLKGSLDDTQHYARGTPKGLSASFQVL